MVPQSRLRVILVAGITVLLLLAIACLWSPPSAPTGQRAFTTLSSANVSEFATAFDRDADAT